MPANIHAARLVIGMVGQQKATELNMVLPRALQDFRNVGVVISENPNDLAMLAAKLIQPRGGFGR